MICFAQKDKVYAFPPATAPPFEESRWTKSPEPGVFPTFAMEMRWLKEPACDSVLVRKWMLPVVVQFSDAVLLPASNPPFARALLTPVVPPVPGVIFFTR